MGPGSQPPGHSRWARGTGPCKKDRGTHTLFHDLAQLTKTDAPVAIRNQLCALVSYSPQD